MPNQPDNFGKFAPQFEAPFSGAFSITKSDSANTTYATRAIYVGGAGNLVVDMIDGANNVSFIGVPVGTTLPLRVRKVKNATTATNLVGLY